MAAKFPKANVQIAGNIKINIYDPNLGDKIIDIELSPVKTGKSGVYCLRNKLNGRLYIGQTKNLERRKWRHFNDLKSGKHPSKLLQQDYNDFVVNNCNKVESVFSFEIIQYCYPSQLSFWEGLLIDNLNPYYNPKKKKDIRFSNPYAEHLEDDDENYKDLDF